MLSRFAPDGIIPEEFKLPSLNHVLLQRKDTKMYQVFFYRHLGSMPLFNHTHVVNGVIIVHSHINTGEHTHSKQSLEIIFFLSNILAFGDFQSSFIPVPCSFPIRVPPLVPALSDMTTISRGVFSLYCCPLKVGKQ